MGAFEAIFVATVLLVMLVLLFLGWKTPEVVVFLALVLVWNMGVVSTSDALSGFNNPGVLAVGSLFVVIKGVEKSRLADKAAQHVFGMQTSYTTGLLRLMGLTFILSAFLNNTPVVALLIPTTCDWARTRGFSAAQLLMPLSFSCIFGGLLTIIGTSTNLVVQGLVIEAGMSDSSVKGLGFFEPGYIGLPLGLVGMTYLVFAAPRILPSTRDSTLSGRGQDNCDLEEYLTEVTFTKSCALVGKPFALALARLGLPVESLMKVRRKLTDEDAREAVKRDENSGLSQAGVDGEVGVEMGCEAVPSMACPDQTVTHRRVHSTAAEDSIPIRKRQGSDQRNGWTVDADSVAVTTITDSSKTAMGNEGYSDIHPVPHAECIRTEDSIFLRCARSTVIEFLGSIVSQELQGLCVLDLTISERPGRYTEAYEVVVSEANGCIGCCPSGSGSGLIATRYDCSVVGVRTPTSLCVEDNQRRSNHAQTPHKMLGSARYLPVAMESKEVLESLRTPESNGGAFGPDHMGTVRDGTWELEVTRRPLCSGDVLLVLSEEGFYKRWKDSQDFDMVTWARTLPSPVRMYDYLALLVFSGMLLWVLFSGVIMVRAAFAAGGVLIVGGWVDAKKAVGYVDWALLLLVGSALGLSKAIANSGLADYAGEAIRDSGMSASASLYVLYGFTMMCTELITNNAAAALAVPVALSIARELEVDYKPFVVTVMMAASSSFITPIGYQTNTMVWRPGGYKFSDFIKLGAPLSLLNLLIGSFLMPYVFPF